MSVAHRPWPGGLTGALLPACLLLAVAGAAYETALGARFVFDDILMSSGLTPGAWPFELLFSLQKDGTAAGRPVMAFSWSVNAVFAHWEEGARLPSPRSFVAVNVVLHVATGLALFFLAERLLGAVRRLEGLARSLALAAAALWTVHPLTTSAVTYAAQRAEVLMSLFFVLALLCSCRALEPGRRGLWVALATLFAWLSVGSKEVGALVPIAFWLIHRALFSRSGGLRDHKPLYAGLASAWLLTAGLLATAPRPDSVGWFSQSLNPLNYLLTQGNALVHYARLVVWPSPLLVDYGWPIVEVHRLADLGRAWPSYGPALVAVAAAVVATAIGFFRAPRASLPMALCFLVLGPSSSILPIRTEIMAEHRMYLPMAALLVGILGVAGLQLEGRGRSARACFALVVASLAFASVVATRERNLEYASPVELWAANARHTPQNSRAFLNWGAFLTAVGRFEEAFPPLQRAADLAEQAAGPERKMLPLALHRLGGLEDRRGRPAQAIALLERALVEDPENYDASKLLLDVLIRQGLWERAEQVAARSREVHPEIVWAGLDLVLLDLRAGRDAQARAGVARELGLPPDDPQIPLVLSDLARRAGRAGLAVELLRETRSQP